MKLARFLVMNKLSFSLALLVFAGSAVGAVPKYPKGVWAGYGVGPDIPPSLVDNIGIVGVGVSEDWNEIEVTKGVYSWGPLDGKIAKAKAAGFKINLVITNSSDNTPTWLLDGSQTVNPVQIDLLDPASVHKTFCQQIHTCLYWDAAFHAARLALIAAAGKHYTSDPEIVAVTAQFANHNSNDWNIQDTAGTIVCPSCPQTPPTKCGNQTVDQPAQWLAVGWTEQQMVQVGKDILDAYAAAFPNQNIKLPIGGLEDRLASTDPAHTNGTYTTMARDIENYVYGNTSLGILPQTYANRLFMQRNIVDATWGEGTKFDGLPPGFASPQYIKWMIRQHARPDGLTPGQAGLQMVAAASLGASDGCRLAGGTNGPCGPGCADQDCVIQTALDLARTYGTDFIEIFPQDGQNTSFYSIITDATVKMGGTPRNTPAPPTGLRIISSERRCISPMSLLNGKAFQDSGDFAMR